MIRVAAGLTLMLNFISFGGFAQNVAGFWLGVTYPADPDQEVYNYTMTLTQTAGALGGTAQTANPNVPFGGTAYLSGRVAGTTVTFSEADQTGSTTVKDVCFWRGKLTYNPIDESLIGTYESIVNTTTCTEAAGGRVELYRIVLKSGTRFCKGKPTDLLVTGKNIRWYSSAAKTSLLARGNTYSPKLTQTTTFYITQTLYKNESPTVPITIEVVEPTFTATATNVDCGQTNGTITVSSPGAVNWQYKLNSGAYQAQPAFANLGPGTYTVSVKDGAGCEAERVVTLTANAAPVLGDVKTISPRCGQTTGEITLVTTGGTGALRYSLNGTTFQSQSTFQNLPGGNYTIRVRDAKGCEVSKAVSLPVSFSIGIANIVATPATCGKTNGSVVVTIAGGNGAVEYSADGRTYQTGSTFLNLKGGQYRVQIRDGAGCTATQSANVAGNSPVIDTLIATPPRCGTANGELSIRATGGDGPLAYSTDGLVYQPESRFTNLPGGNYTAWVRDVGGCEVSKTVRLPASNPLLIVRADTVPTTCGLPNGRASITVTGGVGPIRFSTDGRRAQTSSRFDSLRAGTYTLFAQDSIGCTAGRLVTIAPSTMPTITDVTVTPEACGQRNASITVATAQPDNQYTFAINEQSFQSGNVFSGLSAGKFTISVRDKDACLTTRPVILTADCANVIHLPMAFSPNADNLNDALASYFSFPLLTVATFVVYDRWGSVVYSRTNFTLTTGEPLWNGQREDGSETPPGIYPYALDCRFPDGTQLTYRQSVALVK